MEKHIDKGPFFKTRGIVLTVSDLESLDWPQRAKEAHLTTIGTHKHPGEVAKFVQTDKGQEFLARCAELGIEVEHELHAMGELLPRDLFRRDPSMFRMTDKQERAANANCCVHSKNALEVICSNAVKYAKLLRPTTGRYFYWFDDAKPMCRCPQCRGYSDSDQALILENALIQALQQEHAGATLAHLAYLNTITPPTQVKPAEGVFLEFAPIFRSYTEPISQRDAKGKKQIVRGEVYDLSHGEYLDLLDANLEWFGSENAQVLEYWLDVSLAEYMTGLPREQVQLPWTEEVFEADVQAYGGRGIRHITSFGAYIDRDYIARHGEPPIGEYGRILKEYR